VALGHLHKPQKVGQAHIRYSGSPIPLSFSEINYKHQIVDVKIDPFKQMNHALSLKVYLFHVVYNSIKSKEN
jgi:exonuclease SbcD